MTRQAFLPILVAVGALAVAAPSVAGAAGPSAWAKSADAICKQANKDIDAIAEPKNTKELASATEKLLAIGIRQTNDLAKLSRPSSDAKEIGTLIGYYNDQVSVGKKLLAAVKQGDMKKAQAIIESGNATGKKVDALVTKLGAKACTG